jgi:hypothetical protein
MIEHCSTLRVRQDPRIILILSACYIKTLAGGNAIAHLDLVPGVVLERAVSG